MAAARSASCTFIVAVYSKYILMNWPTTLKTTRPIVNAGRVPSQRSRPYPMPRNTSTTSAKSMPRPSVWPDCWCSAIVRWSGRTFNGWRFLGMRAGHDVVTKLVNAHTI